MRACLVLSLCARFAYFRLFEIGMFIQIRIPDWIPNRWSCFATESDRVNRRSFAYWSGVEYAPNTTNAWNFNTNNGNQNNDNKDNNNLFVWPVRSGE